MNFFSKIKKAIHWRYHRIRNLWPIWQYFLNYKGRIFFKKHAGKLSELESEIAEDLKKGGIAFAKVTDFVSQDFFEELRKKARELNEKVSRVSGEKKFFRFLLGSEEDVLPLDLLEPFARFSLSESILRITGEYIGSSPIFNSYSVRATNIVPEDSTPYLSQRWHRDPDDKKMLKVFVYLTDVLEEGAGPFSYVKGSQYGGKWRNIFPQIPPVGAYPPLGAVEKIVPKEDIRVCLAPCGTIIFADTSGLHKGGFSTTRIRIMSISDYLSAASKQEKRYLPPDEGGSKASNLSPLARYAIFQ